MGRRNRKDSLVESHGRKKRVFTAWCNMHLKSRGEQINDLYNDIGDGVLFVRLVGVLEGTSVQLPFLRPQSAEERTANIEVALNILQQKGVQLFAIGTEEIVSREEKVVLALVWVLIQKYQIHTAVTQHRRLLNVVGSPPAATQAITEWVNEELSVPPYDELRFVSFLTSLCDGVVLCALVHRQVPYAFDFSTVSSSAPVENIALALRVADEHLCVPPLLTVDDVRECMEAQTLVTYVSLLMLRKFASQAEGSPSPCTPARRTSSGRLRRISTVDGVLSPGSWTTMCNSESICALAATDGRLFAVTDEGQLLARPAWRNQSKWQRLGSADGVVDMTVLGQHLLGVTSSGTYVARHVDDDVSFKTLGAAFPTTGVGACGDYVYAASPQNELFRRPALQRDEDGASWELIGSADDITDLAGHEEFLFATTCDNILMRRLAVREAEWEQVGEAEEFTRLASLEGFLIGLTSNCELLVRSLASEDCDTPDSNERNTADPATSCPVLADCTTSTVNLETQKRGKRVQGKRGKSTAAGDSISEENESAVLAVDLPPSHQTAHNHAGVASGGGRPLAALPQSAPAGCGSSPVLRSATGRGSQARSSCSSQQRPIGSARGSGNRCSSSSSSSSSGGGSSSSGGGRRRAAACVEGQWTAGAAAGSGHARVQGKTCTSAPVVRAGVGSEVQGVARVPAAGSAKSTRVGGGGAAGAAGAGAGAAGAGAGAVGGAAGAGAGAVGAGAGAAGAGAGAGAAGAGAGAVGAGAGVGAAGAGFGGGAGSGAAAPPALGAVASSGVAASAAPAPVIEATTTATTVPPSPSVSTTRAASIQATPGRPAAVPSLPPLSAAKVTDSPRSQPTAITGGPGAAAAAAPPCSQPPSTAAATTDSPRTRSLSNPSATTPRSPSAAAAAAASDTPRSRAASNASSSAMRSRAASAIAEPPARRAWLSVPTPTTLTVVATAACFLGAALWQVRRR